MPATEQRKQGEEAETVRRVWARYAGCRYELETALREDLPALSDPLLAEGTAEALLLVEALIQKVEARRAD